MSMRKFCLRTVCFLIPVALLLMGLEVYVRSLPNSYKQKYQWMEQHADEVEVLLLGNSHGLFGLRPEVFLRKTYNLCNVSQIFEYDEFLLRHFLPKCPRLTDVFLIVDNSNLFDPPLELTEDFRCAYYRIYMHYPKHSFFSKYGFELSHVEAFKEKLIKGGDTCDSLGWNPDYTKAARIPSNVSPASARMAAEHHRCKDWAYAEANREALLRICDLCRQYNVRLILLQAPVTHAYYERVDQHQRNFLRRCCSMAGMECADYTQDPHFSDDDFFDADHLTDVGALKWSTMIAADSILRKVP